MKKIKLLFVFVIALFTVQGYAKVIEVNQLFNKKLVKVKSEKVGVSKSFYGKTMVDESKIIDITTRYDGFVTSINANKTLAAVKKGMPLFSIYSDKVLSIQKEVQIAKTINKNLYTSALEKLTALDIHKKELSRMKASKKAIKNIRVFAPSNAIVLKKNINQGSYVKSGKLLMQLANIDTLWFVAQVYQKDLAFIEPNMKALIKIDGSYRSVKSTVDYIYPMVNEKTKTVDVRFIVENKDLKLYPNMFAKVQLKSARSTMLTLPKTAVLTKGEKHYVFKPVSADEFEPVLVEAKRLSSSKYKITDGLKVGEEVVNNALFLLDSDAITNSLYDDEDTDW